MKIVSESFDGNKKNVSISDVPEICPICQAHNAPSRVAVRHKGIRELEIVYQCANIKCNSLFIAYYEGSVSQNDFYYLKRVAPRSFKDI